MFLKKPTVMSKLFIVLLLLLQSSFLSAQNGFTNLFNGNDLSGWKILGGRASFAVEDGIIVGRTVANTGNTFLVTEKQYGDFILELDIYVEDEEGNSGVQTRSHFDAEANHGAVSYTHLDVYKRQALSTKTFDTQLQNHIHECNREIFHRQIRMIFHKECREAIHISMSLARVKLSLIHI